jgi:hypothetical protein
MSAPLKSLTELVRETDGEQEREALDVDAASVEVLARWYEFGREVLDHPSTQEPTEEGQ